MISIHSVDEFKETIIDGEGYYLVDFSAQWCGPCKMMAPILDELEQEYADKIAFYKVDIDELPELATGFGIFAVPTMLVLKNKKIETAFQGAQSKEMLTAKIDALLNNTF